MTGSTPARREPLTVGATAPLFCAVATAVAVTASAAAALTGGEVGTGWHEAVALALVAAAGAVLTAGAGPFLAPFRRRVHVLVLGLLLPAAVLDAAAHGGAVGGTLLISAPLLLLALAVLRPPGEVLVGGAVLAVAAVAGVLAAPWSPGTLSRAVGAGTAVLAPALAAAAFGRVTLRRLGEQPAAAPPVEPVPSIRLSLQQEAVARLEAEAIPLLTRVAGAGALVEADRVRAADIAGRLRAALVADLARGWLAELGLVVDDRDGYGERMSVQQRTALRATLSALPVRDPARPGRAVVRGQDRDAEVRLQLPLRGRPDRRRLAAVVPLLRSAFADADVAVEEEQAVVAATWTLER